ncbi:MAG: hypothetical protein WCT18_01675 [Patescibacteria group bacterium]
MQIYNIQENRIMKCSLTIKLGGSKTMTKVPKSYFDKSTDSVFTQTIYNFLLRLSFSSLFLFGYFLLYASILPMIFICLCLPYETFWKIIALLPSITLYLLFLPIRERDKKYRYNKKTKLWCRDYFYTIRLFLSDIWKTDFYGGIE